MVRSCSLCISKKRERGESELQKLNLKKSKIIFKWYHELLCVQKNVMWCDVVEESGWEEHRAVQMRGEEN
jgi:hypothetical protein